MRLTSALERRCSRNRSYSDLFSFRVASILTPRFLSLEGYGCPVHRCELRPAFLQRFKAGTHCETIILSTSSDPFLNRYHECRGGSQFRPVRAVCYSVLLKENRGGSRLCSRPRDNCIRTPAQLRKVQHSVGVGDCFDVVFAVMRRKMSDRAALAYASCIASEYAGTTYPELFRDAAVGWLAVPRMKSSSWLGVSSHGKKGPACKSTLRPPTSTTLTAGQ